MKDKFDWCFPILMGAGLLWMAVCAVIGGIYGIYAVEPFAFGGFFALMFALGCIATYGMITGRM